MGSRLQGRIKHMITKVDLKNHKHVNAYLKFPFDVYRGVNEWVPPLWFEARKMMNPRTHPFYQHSQAAFFLHTNTKGEINGRIAVCNNSHYDSFNHTRAAFFFGFECKEDFNIARDLFNTAFDWAKSRHLTSISGAKGFSALDGLGILVDGFEHRPAFGIPYNLPYYGEFIEKCGFKRDGDIVSGYLDNRYRVPEKVRLVADRVELRRGLRVARFRSRRDLRALVPKLHELYNRSIVGTLGNAPLTEAEAKAMTEQLIWFADPHLIKILFKGDELVGYLFAYPDISAAVQRCRGKLFPFGWAQILLELKNTKWININGAGIIEEYRGMGGTAILFREMENAILEGGYEHADLVQMGVDNERIQLEMKALGVDFYKRHRMYKKTL